MKVVTREKSACETVAGSKPAPVEMVSIQVSHLVWNNPNLCRFVQIKVHRFYSRFPSCLAQPLGLAIFRVPPSVGEVYSRGIMLFRAQWSQNPQVSGIFIWLTWTWHIPVTRRSPSSFSRLDLETCTFSKFNGKKSSSFCLTKFQLHCVCIRLDSLVLTQLERRFSPQLQPTPKETPTITATWRPYWIATNGTLFPER